MLPVQGSSWKFPSACLPSLTWCAYLLWLENSQAEAEGGGFWRNGGRCDPGRIIEGSNGSVWVQRRFSCCSCAGGLLVVACSSSHNSWGCETLVSFSACSKAVRLRLPRERTVGPEISLLQLNWLQWFIFYFPNPSNMAISSRVWLFFLLMLWFSAMKYVMARCWPVTIAGGREEK